MTRDTAVTTRSGQLAAQPGWPVLAGVPGGFGDEMRASIGICFRGVARVLDDADDDGLGPRTQLARSPLTLIRWLTVGSFALVVVTWIARPWTVGDTPFVLDGTNAFLDCLSDHDFVACRLSKELDAWGLLSPIGDWPLLQHIPDLVMVGVGVESHNARERVLALLSVVGVVGSVLVARSLLSRVGLRPWFWGFLLVVLSGPIVGYARTTSGEALAAGLLVCFVAATVLPLPPPLVACATLAACLTKETSYPFVAALGLLGLLFARERTGEPVRRHVVWGAGGMAVGITLASLFNVVRFGSVLNTNYLQPELHTHGVGRVLENSVALFVSPSGGVVVFWPAAALLLALACILPLGFHARRHLDPKPALVLIGVIAGLTVGFASWWTPFGWSAYGSRFTVPWIPSLVLLGLVVYGQPLAGIVSHLLAPLWRLALVFALLFLLALPHVGYMGDATSTNGFFEGNGRMWSGRPMGLYALDGLVAPWGVVLALAIGVALLGCLLLLRDELPRHPLAGDDLLELKRLGATNGADERAPGA